MRITAVHTAVVEANYDWTYVRVDADEDGLSGLQQLAHDANLLFYMSEEAQEGRNAYLEKRKPDFAKFPHRA